jgi:hypothetical protein
LRADVLPALQKIAIGARVCCLLKGKVSERENLAWNWRRALCTLLRGVDHEC